MLSSLAVRQMRGAASATGSPCNRSLHVASFPNPVKWHSPATASTSKGHHCARDSFVVSSATPPGDQRHYSGLLGRPQPRRSHFQPQLVCRSLCQQTPEPSEERLLIHTLPPRCTSHSLSDACPLVQHNPSAESSSRRVRRRFPLLRRRPRSFAPTATLARPGAQTPLRRAPASPSAQDHIEASTDGGKL